MADLILDKTKQILIEQGFKPSRGKFIVVFLRKLIWPFIRPFHFFHIDELNKLRQQLEISTDEFNIKIQAAAFRLDQQEQEHEKNLQQAIQALKQENDLLRTDLVTLTNQWPKVEECYLSVTDKFTDLYARVNNLQQWMIQSQQVRQDEIRKFNSCLFLLNTGNGVFLLKNGDLISERIRRDLTWDPHLIPVINEVADSRGGIAIDAGAHFGFFSVCMAQKFSQVYSFEANPYNFRILNLNIKLNNLENISAINAPLFSKEVMLSLGRPAQQEVDFPITKNGDFDLIMAGNLGGLCFTEDGMNIFVAKSKTLDSYRLNDVSFIKIDCQGADGEIIMGASDTIERCKPVIVFEWEEGLAKNFSVQKNAVMEKLEKLGYIISVLKEYNEKQIDYIARPQSQL